MPQRKKTYTVKRSITVRDLADLLGKRPYEVIAEFMAIHIFTHTTQPLASEHLGAYSERYGVTFTIVG